MRAILKRYDARFEGFTNRQVSNALSAASTAWFEDNLADASPRARQRFYRDNFIDLMGLGLDADLHDHPSVAA